MYSRQRSASVVLPSICALCHFGMRASAVRARPAGSSTNKWPTCLEIDCDNHAYEPYFMSMTSSNKELLQRVLKLGCISKRRTKQEPTLRFSGHQMCKRDLVALRADCEDV